MNAHFSLLGPLEISIGRVAVPLPSAMVRATLAVLLLAEGRFVQTSTMIRALWDAPPKSARSNLRSYLARLRATLRSVDVSLAARLVTNRNHGGCRLDVPPGAFDVPMFMALAERGHTHLSLGEHHAAATLLRDALRLWRGPAGEDLTTTVTGTLQRHLADLNERRLIAWEDYIEVRLSLADTSGLLNETRYLTTHHPLRERPWEQLMRVLYLSGDPAGSLEAYRTARQIFHDVLGIEPSPRLGLLQQAILRRDETVLRQGLAGRHDLVA